MIAASVVLPLPDPRRPVLTRAQVDGFATALDALRDAVLADRGDRDARYIRSVVRFARGAGLVGRALIGLGWDPVSFAIGVAALSLAKVLENMEIGHNVMHGQYDFMNDPALDSRTYEWDMACASADWRLSHNQRHHTWTNVLGRDDDFGYGVFRMSPEQRWRPLNLVQPLWNVVLATVFQWGIGSQDIQVFRWLDGRVTTDEIRTRSGPFLRKAARQLFKDYVLFPLLTPWNAPRVLAGNLLANLCRNVWSHAIIFCGHFTTDVQTFSQAEAAVETRGDWYVRQVLSSSNIDGGAAFHVLSGHLSHQIEHHLFPDLPAPRYRELAPAVRALCATYGIPYNTGGFAVQYLGMVRRIVRYALPGGA